MISILRNLLATLFLLIFVGNSIVSPMRCAPPNLCVGPATACECGGTPKSTSMLMAACTMICQMQVPAPDTIGLVSSTVIDLLFDTGMTGMSGHVIAPPVPPPRLA